MGRLIRTLAVGVVLVAAGCAASPRGEKAAITQSVAWTSRATGPAWSLAADEALRTQAPNLMSQTPRDIDAFCPAFRTSEAGERRAFYVALLAEVAKLESGLDGGAQSAQADPDRPGQQIVSRGLLKIAPEEAKAAGCVLSRPEDLFDPATNLQCGVRVLDRAVTADGLLAGWDQGWRGASRTWTSLRDREKLADLQASLNAQPYCAPRRRRNV